MVKTAICISEILEVSIKAQDEVICFEMEKIRSSENNTPSKSYVSYMFSTVHHNGVEKENRGKKDEKQNKQNP